MFFQYMTSNVPFRNQADTNILNIRMRDAAAQGLKLPDWCTPEFYSYEHNKNQRIMLLNEIAKNPNYILVDEYCDENLSGAGTYRPEFERLKDDIKSKKINKI